jgi:hypothetical protein
LDADAWLGFKEWLSRDRSDRRRGAQMTLMRIFSGLVRNCRRHDQEKFAAEPRWERGLRFKIVFAPSINGRTAASG